jgi:hypothetical protein
MVHKVVVLAIRMTSRMAEDDKKECEWSTTHKIFPARVKTHASEILLEFLGPLLQYRSFRPQWLSHHVSALYHLFQIVTQVV